MLEALIGLAIAVCLMTGLGTFVLFQNRKLAAETQTVGAEQQLRAVLELVAADLREAGRRAPGESYSSESAPPGLCSRESTRVRMTADLDGDGTTEGPGEDVSYCLCPGSGPRPLYRAYRTLAGSFIVDRVADAVSAFALVYAPRSVTVSMTTAVATPLGIFSQSARAETFLRNVPSAVSCAAAAPCPPAECPA